MRVRNLKWPSERFSDLRIGNNGILCRRMTYKSTIWTASENVLSMFLRLFGLLCMCTDCTSWWFRTLAMSNNDTSRKGLPVSQLALEKSYALPIHSLDTLYVESWQIMAYDVKKDRNSKWVTITEDLLDDLWMWEENCRTPLFENQTSENNTFT